VAFSVSFATLNTAKKNAIDPFPEVRDARKWVGGEFLTARSGAQEATVERNLQTLGPQERSVLEGYA
jgi:hypothetical protein